MTTFPEPMKISSPTLHATIFVTIGVFITVLVMSFVFKVEVVARGEGRIVPISRVQVVQPEFAGKITAIHVRNGDLVEAGQTLIEIDATEAQADLRIIQAEQNRLTIEQARIDAMVTALDSDPSSINFTDDTLARFTVPDTLAGDPFTAEQRRLLLAEINDFLAALDQIDAREAANLRAEDVTNANIARVTAAVEFQSERLQISEQLLEQGTTSRSNFLDVEQAATELERERDIYLKQLQQQIAQRAALNTERRQITAELRRTLLARKAEIDARQATLEQDARAALRQVGTATLTAPVSGIVDQLSVFTIGGITDAGAELLRIVPTDVQVEIEGAFPNQDIGFMHVGQQANIRLDAFPSERFGSVKGEVTDIAADSTENASGQWGYVVRVTPDSSVLQAGDDAFPLRPGMTATIDVTTDTRRIISYFFAPIVRTIQDAMGER